MGPREAEAGRQVRRKALAGDHKRVHALVAEFPATAFQPDPGATAARPRTGHVLPATRL